MTARLKNVFREWGLAGNQNGVAVPILLAIVLFALSGAGWYVYKFGYENPFSKIVQPESAVQVSTPDISYVDPVDVNGWQTLEIKYGRLKLKYPPKWVARYDPAILSSTRYVDFFYTGDSGVIGNEAVMTLSIGKFGSFGNTYTEKNYNIPGLGKGNNAYFYQYNGPTTVLFEKDGAGYQFNLFLDSAIRLKIDPVEANRILTGMVKSVEISDEQGSCSDPVLRSLDDFPESFILVNRHKSDLRDPVAGYWPMLSLNNPGSLPPPPVLPIDFAVGNDSSYPPGFTSDEGKRFFVGVYTSDGQQFDQSPEFVKSVVEIEGGQDVYAPEEKTAIFNVNCIELLESGQAMDLYSIGRSGTDPFEIDMYGKASNATALWGVEKWNAALLQKTRGEVYIRRGDKWQKYTARPFIVAN